MEQMFVDELNSNCYCEGEWLQIEWTLADIDFIKHGSGKSYCNKDGDLCDSCKQLCIGISNFYSEVDIRELYNEVQELKRKSSSTS